MQVLNEGTESLVEKWEILSASPEVIAVPVPAGKPHGDAARSSLDKTACHQKLVKALPTAISLKRLRTFAVSINELGVFFRQIESVGESARSKHAKGLLVKRIETFHHARLIDFTTELIKA